MEALQKIVFPEEVHPVRNSSPAIARLETKRGIRSYPAYRQAGGIILECNPATGGTAEHF